MLSAVWLKCALSQTWTCSPSAPQCDPLGTDHTEAPWGVAPDYEIPVAVDRGKRLEMPPRAQPPSCWHTGADREGCWAHCPDDRCARRWSCLATATCCSRPFASVALWCARLLGAQPSQHAVLMKHFEPLVPRTSAPQPTAAACAVALLSACRRHMAPQASAFAAADAIDRQRSVTARGLMESN